MTNFAAHLDVDASTLRVSNRETAHREFKLAYTKADLSRYARTMAAFANAQGGIIIFGVRDKPRELVGCGTAADLPDVAEIATQLQNWFDPPPRFEILEDIILGKRLLALSVDECPSKPVICKKTYTAKKVKQHPSQADELEAALSEGDIYYRYTPLTPEPENPWVR
jgi:predicted HTH transcriptional regulator